MTIEDLEISILTNMPDGYSYKVNTYKVAGKFLTNFCIYKRGILLEGKREDSLYWALKSINEYFLTITKLKAA